MRARFLTALALAAAACAPVAAAELSPAERRMIAAVDASHDADIALLERMVNINSGTMNFAGVERIGTLMRAEFEPLGFTVRWVPMSAVDRSGHLIAERRSSTGKRLLLIGHLDTVFETDSPFQRFERRGDVAEGPGSNDMKGGLVVMLSALRAMQAAGTLEGADITVVLTGDEENVGRPHATSRAELLTAGRRADAALDFEGLGELDGVDAGSISRRSSNTWTVTTTGSAGHSSGVFGEARGFGAIYELARILDDFREELREPDLTYNVGLVLGGAAVTPDPRGDGGSAQGKANIVPGRATATGDARTIDDAQTERVKAKMEAITARHLPKTGANIVFETKYPSMAPTAGNRALLDALNAVNRDLGLAEMKPLPPAARGAGDIAFVAKDVDGLVGLGAGGEGAHAVGETVDLKSLTRQAQRAALLMTRLSREPRPAS